MQIHKVFISFLGCKVKLISFVLTESEECGTNEVFKENGRNCRCTDSALECGDLTGEPGCYCIPAHFRLSNGTCVFVRECILEIAGPPPDVPRPIDLPVSSPGSPGIPFNLPRPSLSGPPFDVPGPPQYAPPLDTPESGGDADGPSRHHVRKMKYRHDNKKKRHHKNEKDKQN